MIVMSKIIVCVKNQVNHYFEESFYLHTLSNDILFILRSPTNKLVFLQNEEKVTQNNIIFVAFSNLSKSITTTYLNTDFPPYYYLLYLFDFLIIRTGLFSYDIDNTFCT